MYKTRVEFVYPTPYIDPDHNELKALQHIKVPGLIPSEKVWQQHEPIHVYPGLPPHLVLDHYYNNQQEGEYKDTIVPRQVSKDKQQDQ